MRSTPLKCALFAYYMLFVFKWDSSLVRFSFSPFIYYYSPTTTLLLQHLLYFCLCVCLFAYMTTISRYYYPSPPAYFICLTKCDEKNVY